MEETQYRCKKCYAEIKSTDEKCPNCGSILNEVGRHIELVLEDRLIVEDLGKVKMFTAKKISRYRKEVEEILRGEE